MSNYGLTIKNIRPNIWLKLFYPKPILLLILEIWKVLNNK